MPGLGSSPLGAGPLGFDPVAPLSAAPTRRAPVAAVYDPRLRDLVLDDDGAFADNHPVDQAVILTLTIALGTIASAEAIGQAFTEIAYVGNDITAIATDRIRAALKSRVDAGDVSLESVAVEPNGQGFLFAVAYRNLRLPNAKPRNVTLSS